MVRERLMRFAASRGAQPIEIVSYDVPGDNNATAVAVSHFVFGRTDRVRVNGGQKEYHYPGLIERPGVVWMGQSVFLLSPERSEEMRGFLERRGVAYGRIVVRPA